MKALPVIAGLAALVIAVVFLGYASGPDNSDPAITETQTTNPVPADEEPTDTMLAGGNDEIFTMQDYDPQELRTALAAADMPDETRETYLRRLDEAEGDEDALAEVLEELRIDTGLRHELDMTAGRTMPSPEAHNEDDLAGATSNEAPVPLPRNEAQSRVVEDKLAEIRAVVEEVQADTVDGTQQTDPVNDETALNAPMIDADTASMPSRIAEILQPERFEAERVVALVKASPRLTDTEKLQLQRAVQAVADIPEARAEVLDSLRILLMTVS